MGASFDPGMSSKSWVRVAKLGASPNRPLGSFAWMLGVGAWLTPWLALFHDGLADSNVHLPFEVLVLPSVVAVSTMLAVGSLMGQTRLIAVIPVLGAAGASVTFGASALAIGVLEEVATVDDPWFAMNAVAGSVLAAPVGFVLSIPALVIAGARVTSHDDGDMLTALTGVWTVLAGLFAVGVPAADADFPFRWVAESVPMLVMNVGAVMFAIGVVRTVERRRWLRRAQRGEIESVRVRALGPLESPPPVLPLVRSTDSPRAVIEVIERTGDAVYRGVELARPIAIV